MFPPTYIYYAKTITIIITVITYLWQTLYIIYLYTFLIHYCIISLLCFEVKAVGPIAHVPLNTDSRLEMTEF